MVVNKWAEGAEVMHRELAPAQLVTPRTYFTHELLDSEPPTPGYHGPHVASMQADAANTPPSQEPTLEQATHPVLLVVVARLYSPAGHAVHTPAPDKLYVPAPQGDAVAFTEPAGHAKPAEHGPEQLAEVSPEAEPYRPAGQGVQVPAPRGL